MAEVVSLNKWKKEHPKKVVVVVQDYMYVTIFSEDFRTEHAHMVCQREITNRELNQYINDFRNENPGTIVVDVLLRAKELES